ncbi:MAG: NADH-quinone oxidoreductase subunit L [Pelagibacterales bacterium]|nr:NADH-quinone oxidoreductase subunit L [Pelagibacterales bacterium]
MPIFIFFLPLLSTFICFLCVLFKENRKAEILSSLLISIAAFLSILCYLKINVFVGNYNIYNWINLGNIELKLSVFYDPLTAIMFLVVNSVSALVHIFSIGYMASDPYRARFFCYLSLFTFAMLILVSADNFIQLFLGWEGVGLCSYLLVGFYFSKLSASNAALKAFLVNRVGDFGYLIAIALIFTFFQSLNFEDVFSNSASYAGKNFIFFGYDVDLLTTITMFLFLAAMGKSAQIGLHVWLPDAMEGPTPVSALIHAATMVTAGVFLVARCSPLFEMAHLTLNFITYIGLVTCLFAASVALLQDDIKKIIAYSTCSQLGYMFFACGISAYSLGIFHLVTHAFFKALLFLSAGSVIHVCHHEQNIKKMGGLCRKIPITYFFIILGSLALMGIPPFSGYFSKDLILEFAFSLHSIKGNLVYYLGCLGAAMTSIYSVRLIYLTFHGKSKLKTKEYESVKEAPLVMLVPLFLLSLGAIFSGFFFYKIVKYESFWKNSLFYKENINFVDNAHHIPFIFKLFPIITVILFSFLVLFYFSKLNTFFDFTNKSFSKLLIVIKQKWYFDILYNFLFIKKLKIFSKFLWKRVDQKIIDGLGPLGVSYCVYSASRYLKAFQNGKIFSYATFMVLGIILFFSLIFISF